MNEYTASNGMRVRSSEYGDLAIVKSSCPILAPSETQALREFFQAEADERLGRWRDPRWPGIVGYGTDSPDRMLVLNEGTGRVKLRARHGDSKATWREFADAYFAAHPEPEPWQDAKPGEVWEVMVVTGNHEAFAYEDTDGERKFKFSDGGSMWMTDPGITSGRRIYPPVDPS